jgi:hypothetical protein
MIYIQFRSAGRMSYVVCVPEDTYVLSDVANLPDNWQEIALSVFDNAEVVRSDYNGFGSTIRSSSRIIDNEEALEYARAEVLAGIEDGWLPVVVSR